MDKSEGKDFISKTFSSISEKISKLYHTGNMKLSMSTLKRSRSEKVTMLGNKVVELISAGKAITASALKNEYNAIIELDKQIAEAEGDLKKMSAEKAAKKAVAPEKEKTAKTTRTTKKTASEATAKATKATTAKKPAAKKTTTRKSTSKTNLPAVRPKKTAKVTEVTTPTPDVIAVENKNE